MKFPMYQDGTFSSNFKLGFYEYTSLITNPSKCYTHAHPYVALN